ncbi:sugar ABC transporter substrate-binding protein [Kibdelosporangium aridum]|uniref:Sugar ABC transporter substrate-binding protein n=1 Tax=Kibdelosporangium aridum TaxID=2030 RepID=A0A428YZI2_KIBAR|nr:sugar ABC transporter substrate-binding protein [Kibdelosporangium aridum]RSM76739.1 sugar ABC transporter substrate-binding protein [Kibdelosporangium aridum]
MRVTLLALLLVVAGCSSSTGNAEVNLRMTVWTSEKTQLALFDEIANEYKQTNPNVKSITFDVVPFDRYNTALTTQLAGSNPPDLAWILERDAPDFVESKALVNLGPVLKNPEELTPASTKLWQKNGELYAYPFSTSPFGMFYNKDLFAQAGITETPEQAQAAGRWTWDTAMQMAAKVAASTGKSGLVIRDFEYKMWVTLASVWRGFGADAWPQDGKACGFSSPEMLTAMTFLHKAIFADKALPGPGTTADFFAGQSGMTVAQISRAGLLKEKPFQWGIVPLPAGPKANAQVIGQAGIGVPVKGKQKQAAADFLAFFTNPANSAKLSQFFPPARESLINAQGLAKVSPLFSAEQLQNVVVNGIKTGEVLPAHTNSAKINSLVQSALDPLWKPDANVQAVLDGVCKAINPVLSQ